MSSVSKTIAKVPRVKKFVIKPFKHDYSKIEDSVMTTLRELASSFQQILMGNAKGLSFEALYRRVYTLCIHFHGKRVYTLMQLVIRAAAMLNYNRGCAFALMISDCCMFLNNAYAKRHNKPTSQELFQQFYEERRARALERINAIFPSVWREYYLKPGGLFTTKTAKQERWIQASLTRNSGV
tara:strand:- start:7662 stop:8207 length:546 start_codon:yes stop_codon:yes gene_type:complete